jgi:hypothetical protein
LPFIVDLPNENGDVPSFFVSVPEGMLSIKFRLDPSQDLLQCCHRRVRKSDAVAKGTTFFPSDGGQTDFAVP